MSYGPGVTGSLELCKMPVVVPRPLERSIEDFNAGTHHSGRLSTFASRSAREPVFAARMSSKSVVLQTVSHRSAWLVSRSLRFMYGCPRVETDIAVQLHERTAPKLQSRRQCQQYIKRDCLRRDPPNPEADSRLTVFSEVCTPHLYNAHGNILDLCPTSLSSQRLRSVPVAGSPAAPRVSLCTASSLPRPCLHSPPVLLHYHPSRPVMRQSSLPCSLPATRRIPSLRGRHIAHLARSTSGYVVVCRSLPNQFTASALLTKGHAEACAANADFRPQLIGGDGNDIQFCRCTRRKT